jgi:hypothetical protein
MRETRIKRLYRVFENYGTDIHNYDRKIRPSNNVKYECRMYVGINFGNPTVHDKCDRLQRSKQIIF